MQVAAFTCYHCPCRATLARPPWKPPPLLRPPPYAGPCGGTRKEACSPTSGALCAGGCGWTAASPAARPYTVLSYMQRIADMCHILMQLHCFLSTCVAQQLCDNYCHSFSLIAEGGEPSARSKGGGILPGLLSGARIIVHGPWTVTQHCQYSV